MNIRVAEGQHLWLSPGAIVALKQRRYSGNIRELRNLIERATILVDGGEITERHFETPAVTYAVTENASMSSSDAFVIDALVSLEEAGRRYIAWADSHAGGDRSILADRLELSRRTLYRKLAKTVRNK